MPPIWNHVQHWCVRLNNQRVWSRTPWNRKLQVGTFIADLGVTLHRCRALLSALLLFREIWRRVSSRRLGVLLKDVLAVLKMKCDVPVMWLPTTSLPCQFIQLRNCVSHCAPVCVCVCVRALSVWMGFLWIVSQCEPHICYYYHDREDYLHIRMNNCFFLSHSPQTHNTDGITWHAKALNARPDAQHGADHTETQS